MFEAASLNLVSEPEFSREESTLSSPLYSLIFHSDMVLIFLFKDLLIFLGLNE